MITKSMLYWIAENRISKEFPDVNLALAEPDGLLARWRRFKSKPLIGGLS